MTNIKFNYPPEVHVIISAIRDNYIFNDIVELAQSVPEEYWNNYKTFKIIGGVTNLHFLDRIYDYVKEYAVKEFPEYFN